MQKYEEIIQKAWNDDAYKQRLMSFPKEILKELGQDLSENINVKVHENTLNSMHFVLLNSNQVDEASLESDPVIGRVTKRALADSDYKARLLGDPKNAIKEVLGVEPQGKICVHANTETEIHMVLPVNPNVTGDLSDADLAMVAGGKNMNELFCNGASKLFQAGQKFFTGKTGGYLGSLGALANPLMTGGVVFAREASST
ncbi:MAG: NHLP leader peptide family RiPP precursor [SAR324 cluster bacterium]|nr:NHLP leader peptide family RiPP precursor [SAR324 cluster bacterium]MBF0349881.1 NHLP leader peptide family RiPP precursor [SAR324 cluster bacterium]